MIALIIIAAFALYALLALGVTLAVVKLAERRRWLWASFTLLIFFLIPFWDLIPTLVAFRTYCNQEAGFVVLKPLENWKVENAAIVPQLRHDPKAKSELLGERYRSHLNQRLAQETLRDRPEVFLTVRRMERRIVDTQNGEILARYVDFRSGYQPIGVGGPGAWKFWLRRETCAEEFPIGFQRYSDEITKMGRKEK